MAIRFGPASLPLSFKSDLAHCFRAEAFAYVEALYCGVTSLFFGTHDLLHNRVHLVAQAIEGGPVWIFNQDQIVRIMLPGHLAIKDAVVEVDLLLFSLVLTLLPSYR